MARPRTILFLCTGNSARSILAEAILNHRGRPGFRAYSAGSHPSGKIRPEALQQLDAVGFSTQGLRSKSWQEFSGEGAPPIDFVITVCDSAAREACPAWPGHPATAHWGLPDPAAAEGSKEQVQQAFRRAFEILDRRVSRLLALPFVALPEAALKTALQEIGRI